MGDCPSQICDDRYVSMPKAKRLRLFGADGQCLKEFYPDQKGFVVGDGLPGGQTITKRPQMDMPFQKRYFPGEFDGGYLMDDHGRLVENDPGAWDAFIVTDKGGWPNRMQGQANVKSRILWDGCEYVHEPIDPLEGERMIDFHKAPDGHCGVYEAVLIEDTVERVIDGRCEEVKVAKIGYRETPTFPYGGVVPFAGQPGAIPTGYRLCNGDGVGIKNYPNLFAAIGYAWGGAGDVFYLPDLRGQFIRGVDHGAGVDPDATSRTAKIAGGATGANVGSYQDDAFQCHGHEGSITSKTLNTTTTTTTHRGSRVVLASASLVDGSDIDLSSGALVETDCGEPRSSNETRPSNAYVNYLIFAGCDECPS